MVRTLLSYLVHCIEMISIIYCFFVEILLLITRPCFVLIYIGSVIQLFTSARYVKCNFCSVVLFSVTITFYITWRFIQFIDGFFKPIYVRLGINIFGKVLEFLVILYYNLEDFILFLFDCNFRLELAPTISSRMFLLYFCEARVLLYIVFYLPCSSYRTSKAVKN